MLKHVPSIPSLFLAFIIKKCWAFVKTLSEPIMMTMWFLYLIHLIWRITVVDLYIFNYPCIYGKNLSSSWWVLVLISFWVLFYLSSVHCEYQIIIFLIAVAISLRILHGSVLFLPTSQKTLAHQGHFRVDSLGEFNSESTWVWTYFRWKSFDVFACYRSL